MAHAHHTRERHATLTLDGLHCTGCADAVEHALRTQRGVTMVHVDWQANEAHVGYDVSRITEDQLRTVITTTGCRCNDGNGHEHRASPARELQHLKHGVDMQPITMGTKYDRMQYEVPATNASHHNNEPATQQQAAMGHDMSQIDHAAMGHDMSTMDHAAMGHGGMDHDMSDPSMAAAMERDMRTKFFIALVLTIPTVLYSPLGMNFLGVNLPTFGIDMNVIMLVLSTPVVFYCGWMFISGAYHSLRRRAQHERLDRHRCAGGVCLQRADHVLGRRNVL